MNFENNVNEMYKRIDWRKFEPILFFTFLLFYAAYMLFLGNSMSIGGDEAYSLTTTSNRLADVIRLSYYFEGQPPVYFTILALWRKINAGIFFARLLSIIFIFLSGFVLNKILRLFFKQIYTKWTIVLFLLNPFTVWAALEIRLYSLIILLSLTAIYCFYQIYLLNSKTHKYFFVFVCLIGVYTQYYFLFLIISLSLVILFQKGWNSFFKFCLILIPVALLFLPNLLFIQKQFEMHQISSIKYSIYNRINSIIVIPEYFFVSMSSISDRIIRWFVRVIISTTLLYSLYSLRKSTNRIMDAEKLRIIESLISASLLLVVFAIIFLRTNLALSERYFVIVFPFLCIVYSTYRILNKVLYNTIYIFILTYFIFLLCSIYNQPYIKDDDPKSLAIFVEKNEHNNEPILFYDKTTILTFKYYYHGPNSLNPIPELNFDEFFYKNDIKDTTEFSSSINKIGKDSKSIILITGSDMRFNSNSTLTNDLIDTFVKHNYNISIDTTFKGKNYESDRRIRRLEMLQPISK